MRTSKSYWRNSTIPEAQEYPDGMKGSFWMPSDLDIYHCRLEHQPGQKRGRAKGNSMTLPTLNGKTA